MRQYTSERANRTKNFDVSFETPQPSPALEQELQAQMIQAQIKGNYADDTFIEQHIKVHAFSPP